MKICSRSGDGETFILPEVGVISVGWVVCRGPGSLNALLGLAQHALAEVKGHNGGEWVRGHEAAGEHAGTARAQGGLLFGIVGEWGLWDDLDQIYIDIYTSVLS